MTFMYFDVCDLYRIRRYFIHFILKINHISDMIYQINHIHWNNFHDYTLKYKVSTLILVKLPKIFTVNIYFIIAYRELYSNVSELK